MIAGSLRGATSSGIIGLLIVGCSDVLIEDPEGGQGGSGSTSSQTAQSSTMTTSAPSSSTGPETASSTGVGGAPTHVAECAGHVYECGDLVDNDGDGLTDSFDPECFGSCDDSEATYTTLAPDPGPPCMLDCHFDADSGAGNDGCYWDHRCDTHEVAPDYYPQPGYGNACEYTGPDTQLAPPGATCASLATSQSSACLETCAPLTPNGCDCFGCCELPAGSGAYVWLGSTGIKDDSVCTADDVDDPTICHPCDPVPSCANPCDSCEVCIGKASPDPGCAGSDQCEAGAQPCGLAGQLECPAGFYCVTGCCRAVLD